MTTSVIILNNGPQPVTVRFHNVNEDGSAAPDSAPGVIQPGAFMQPCEVWSGHSLTIAEHTDGPTY